MPSMMSSLVQGCKNYKKMVDYQLHTNTVAHAYHIAEFHEKSRVKAVAAAIVGGAGTFLAPPVVIGSQAVKDYRQKQRAEEQKHKVGAMVDCLKSHGISPYGAVQMANHVIKGESTGMNNGISMQDAKMWMVVASVIEPGLAEFTPRIMDHVEKRSEADDTSGDEPADEAAKSDASA